MPGALKRRTSDDTVPALFLCSVGLGTDDGFNLELCLDLIVLLSRCQD